MPSLEGDEVGPAAVHGDLRVDVLLEHVEDPLCDGAGQVASGTVGDRGRCRCGRVRVQHHETLLAAAVADVERRPADLVHARCRDDDREAVQFLHVVARPGVGACWNHMS